MRTDSTRIAQEAVVEVRKLIEKMFGPKFLPAAPRLYGKKKNAQDAHEAIRPSQVDEAFSPDRVQQWLSKDQFRLYELIWKRFLASQMENALLDLTRIDMKGGDCLFRANGSIMKFQGFLALYDETIEDSGENGEDQNETLPAVTAGAAVALQQLFDKQHFTQPPPRYSEASLVRELEDKGIGRPSTYAQIIDTLKRRKYVMLDSRRFLPTEVGFTVKNMLTKEFPDIFDVGFTADMESKLDKIEDGAIEWVAVLKDFYAPFAARLEKVRGSIKELRAQNQEVTDRMCPQCGTNHLVVKWSRNGKFLACQGFPGCKYTETFGAREPAPHGETCDLCGAPMVVLSVNDRKFLGCSRYPERKNTKSLSTGVHCPQPGCEGNIVERRTRRGKLFFGCSAYPKCTFATWDRPVNTRCTACGFPIMVQKTPGAKGRISVVPPVKPRSRWPSPGPRANHRAGRRGRLSVRMTGTPRAAVIGAGPCRQSEAALVLAGKGIAVDLVEMRPGRMTPAHTTALPAELICSELVQIAGTGLGPRRAQGRTFASRQPAALRGARKRRAGGLSPRGRPIAVFQRRRRPFRPRSRRYTRQPRSQAPPEGDAAVILAAGPLIADALAHAAHQCGGASLHFYDAIAPIVAADSIDLSTAFFRVAARPGEERLPNCPLTEEEYRRFYGALREGPTEPVARAFENARFFEACLPIEVMAGKGEAAVAFGPLKPIGLIDPRGGRRPHAAVQLRRENTEGTCYNMVGFQTRLTIPEQRRVFRPIPGLESAEFLRYGSIHRNTYVDSPEFLQATCRCA